MVPSSLGISTRRTGWGRYDRWCSFWCNAWRLASRCCAYIAFVTPSTPGAFVPSSASKHARRLSTREVVHQRRVARLRLPACPAGYPLDSCSRRGSTSGCGRRCHRAVTRHVPPFAPWALPHFVARMGTSDFLIGRRVSFRCAGCATLPPSVEESMRISRVPDSALVTCPGLRPRWVRGSHGPRPL